MKKEEKHCNDEIKQYQDKLKKNNEEFATEAQQSVEDITKLKKNVNETKTESELQVQYMKRVISGAIACMERKQKMEETKLADEIAYLKKQIDVEKTVSNQIVKYYNAKNEQYKDEVSIVEQRKDDKVKDLNEQSAQIQDDKANAELEIQTVNADFKSLQLQKQKQEDLDREEEEKEQAKIK